ncbi:MAG: efflux transporter outer membrane subunit, partial [Gammaproteobacteria bacterium]
MVNQQRASLFPTVNLTGSATRNKHGGSGAQTTSSGQVIGGGCAFNNFQAQRGATWALDIWGQIRRGIEAAHAQAQISDATLANARLSAQSELAADYVALRIADAQMALLTRTVDGYARALKIAQNQYAAGTAARGDVAQAETTLANAKASLVDLQNQRAADEHAIAVLTGRPPAALTLAADPNWAPKVPPTPVELPSTLLQRRPDVASAERNAAVANAQIGVQVAGYFPALTLNGSDGFANTAIQSLFKSTSNQWSIGADVTQTVFNAGATHFKIKQARAAYDQAVAQYRQAALTAFQQVEDNLAAARVLQDEQPLREQASTAADQAEQIALNQYKAGTVAYTGVVTAQASALGARQT